MTVVVRPVEAADAGAVARVYAPYVRDTVISFEEVPPDETAMLRRIERVLATHAWLVADADGEVVGYAYASPHRDRPAYRWAVDVAVYVAPDAHRRGVGTALYRQLLSDLRDRGFRSAWAGITQPNPPSVRLHERLGFVPVGVYRAVGWKHGAWHDVGWWGLDLAGGADSPPPDVDRRR